MDTRSLKEFCIAVFHLKCHTISKDPNLFFSWEVRINAPNCTSSWQGGVLTSRIHHALNNVT